MAENIIEQEKHVEMVKTEPIEVYRNNAHEPSDVADQRSRSNRHITIGGGKWVQSETALWKLR